MSRADEKAMARNEGDRATAGRLLVRKVSVPRPAVSDGGPIKGGMKRAGLAEDEMRELRRASPGTPLTYRELYVLRRRDEPRRLLVLPAGEDGREKALPVFTERELAFLYAQAAGWGDYETADLSPPDLGNWLREAPGAEVTLLAVDPSWLAQQRGEPQPALALGGWEADQPEAIYREIRTLGNQEPAV